MRDKETGLTHKELSLADAYLGNGFHELKAYESSKYSQNCTIVTKRANTTKILKKPHIVAYIARKLDKIAEKAEITAKSIAEEISDIAFGRITANIGVQGNITNKLRALELLGRYKAMFTDNLNTTDTQRQHELDEKAKAEATRIASIRLKEMA